jgi:hypothetical protein
MRIRVSDILEMLAENVSAAEILEDFPDLEPEDIQACLLFAACPHPGRVGLYEQSPPSWAEILQPWHACPSP